MMKKLNVYHPFLFSIFPILFLFSHNIAEVSLHEAMMPLAIALIVPIVLYALILCILKDPDKTGMIVTFFALVFFSYGHIFNIISGIEINAEALATHKLLRQRYFLIPWVFILVLVPILIRYTAILKREKMTKTKAILLRNFVKVLNSLFIRKMSLGTRTRINTHGIKK